MIQQLNSDKITLVKKFKNSIDSLLNFVNKAYGLSIHIKKIDKSYIYLNKLIEAHTDNKLAIVENGILISKILDIINSEFVNIYSNNLTIWNLHDNTKLKDFTYKYSQLKKKYNKIDITLNELIIDSLYIENFGKSHQSTDQIDEINIISTFRTLSNLFKKYTYALPIYKSITLRLLTQFKDNKQIIFSIMDINEQVKSFVISIPNKNLAKNKLPIKDYIDYTINNPYLKTFGLVPVSNIMSLSEISKLIFSLECSSNLSSFTKLCKIKKYDLIVIQKHLNRGINYALLDLLDYNKSKEFSISNNSNDGITIDTIKRFNNIQYMVPTEKRADFKINYNYILKSDNKFTVIIEETYPDKFHVLSNIYTSYITYFVRKSAILEFIEFITSKSGPHSRIEDYNNIINRGILNNMFSGQKYDIKQLEEKSYLPDPNKMRYNIYTEIMEKFNEIKPSFKTIYDFSKLLHNDEFIKIFTNILVREYNIIIKKINYDDSIAELYSSFIRDLSIYERDFEKKMHDGFISQIVKIIESDVFSKSKNECDAEFTEIFDSLLLSVLNDIISIEKNIFQSLNYKLYLLQTT
jgi:hypothetical protein